VRSLLLGSRIALAADRGRLLLTAAGMALGVMFLLSVLSVLPAQHARAERLAARDPQATAEAASGVSVAERGSWWRGHPVTVFTVATRGQAPVPPGLRRLPAPGELAVSPALQRALSGPHRDELAGRLPGRVVEVVGSTGLSGPDELLAWVGAAPAAPKAWFVSAFGNPSYVQRPSKELRIATGLAGLALLIPVLVLIATVTRLSGASRDRRLAAIRLLGATSAQTRRVAAGEALVSGLVGTVLGLPVFLLVRGGLAPFAPVEGGVHASDLWPGPVNVALVLLVVPALSVLVAVGSLRKVITSPLGVRRGVRVRTAGWWRLAPLAFGLLLLTVQWLREGPLATGRSEALLLGGGGLCLVGLAVATPVLSRIGGILLDRVGRGVGSELAARRIAADASASARVVTGSVLVVFVAGWLLAFLPQLPNSLRDLSTTLRPGTVVAGGGAVGDRPLLATDAAGVPGVRGAAQLLSLRGVPAGEDPQGPNTRSVIVGRCEDLSAVLRVPLRCTGASAYRIQLSSFAGAGLKGGERLLFPDAQDRLSPASSYTVPVALPELVLPQGISNGSFAVYGELLVAPQALSRDALQFGTSLLYVATDGSQHSVELVRSALATHQDSREPPLTAAEQILRIDRQYDGYPRAAMIGLVVAVLVGAASLAVSTADAVRERRRGFAALVALGTPLRVLRRSVLLQMGAPLVVNVAVALGSSMLTAFFYNGIVSSTVPLPWAHWALTGAVALGAVLAVTAATLPFVSAAGRPEALRAE
jgi:hypothetical protein